MGKTLKRQQKKLLRTIAVAETCPLNGNVRENFQIGHCVVKINAALQNKRWTKAIELLKSMYNLKKKPKLGSLMRWIRIADTTGNSLLTERLYYWMLMVVGWCPFSRGVYPGLAQGKDGIWTWNPVPRHSERFRFTKENNTVYADPIDIHTGDGIRVCTYPACTIKFGVQTSESIAIPVPFIPNAWLLTDIFSPAECGQFIVAAERLGFQAGVDYSFNSEFAVDATASTARSSIPEYNHHAGRPAEGCFWLVDESIMDIVRQRTMHLLPQAWQDKTLTGINARWRFYRYDPGTLYRPHIDGSWPGSGIDPATGQYMFDAFGDQWSCFTFLVYLNDDFDGGCTRFYLPASGGVDERLETFEVQPRRGSVLVFPHGSLDAALHEGSAVEAGSKFVIRTDVLYTK